MRLTIFDLDNTLLNGDSDFSWGQFLIEKGLVDRDYYEKENERFYQLYKAKALDIYEYQEFVLTPIKAMSSEEFEKLHAEFMSSVISLLRLPKADELIAAHQAEGSQLLIITATNRLIAGPIGPWLGIDEVLATDPEVVDGQLTGAIEGTPCFQDGKITRLKLWLEEQSDSFEHITFYSDSINDLPLLEYSDRPVAVDPDDRLRAHAEAANWEIISLR